MPLSIIFSPWQTLEGGLRAAAVAARGAAVGAAGAEGLALNATGFTALGPAADSYVAAGWMSGIAITNGVGGSAGSNYAALQAAAMVGGTLVGAPVVIGVCAAAGAVAMIVVHYNKRGEGGDGGGDGDAAGDNAMHQ